jgi:hypothetical protein
VTSSVVSVIGAEGGEKLADPLQAGQVRARWQVSLQLDKRPSKGVFAVCEDPLLFVALC